MAGLYSKFLDFIGIEETEDMDDSYYEDDRRQRDDRYNRNDRNDRNDRQNYRNDRNERGNSRYSDDSIVSYNSRNSRYDRGNAPSSAANYPIHDGQKMIVYHPVSYEDTQSIIDNLKNRKPIIVNMEELDVDTAQRILDFLSGAVYAIDGTMCKISRNVFVVAPNSYDVVGNGEDDFSDMGGSF